LRFRQVESRFIKVWTKNWTTKSSRNIHVSFPITVAQKLSQCLVISWCFITIRPCSVMNNMRIWCNMLILLTRFGTPIQ
jgi:hypothetical protein